MATKKTKKAGIKSDGVIVDAESSSGKIYDLSKNSDLFDFIKNTEDENIIKKQVSLHINKLI